MFSKEGSEGTNAPQPLPTPATVRADTAQVEATDFKLIDSILPYKRG